MSPTELVAVWGTEYPAANTREAYERDLRGWFAWCQEHDVDGLAPDRLDVNAYQAELLSRGLKASSVDRKVSACRSFFTYLQERGMLRIAHPFAHVKRLALPGESTTPWIGADDLTKLLTAAIEYSLRDFILISLLGINGLRVSEALRAAVPDLGESNSHRVLKIRRKGEKDGLTPLTPSLADVVDRYLEGRSSGPLIARLDRERQVVVPVRGISRQTAFDRVKVLALWAGVNSEISPHSLRHGFITTALEEGAQLDVVQLAAGHSSPTTTMRYRRGSLNLNSNPSLTLGETLLAGVA